jgi:outer membrane protein OmpA-like peptidoglycan-associated protein
VFFVRLASLLLIAAFIMPAWGRAYHYQSPWHLSGWKTHSSPLRCSLSQKIPLYGTATFSRRAGGKLTFRMNVLRQPDRQVQARIRSVAPEWKHNVVSRELGAVDLRVSRVPIRMGRKDALLLLAELERGMFPTFYYQDWLDRRQQVSVALSSVNFRLALQRFLVCSRALIPYTLQSLRLTRVHFKTAKSSLAPAVRKRLDAIAAYVRHDKSLSVRVDGHADSRGRRRYNFLLSKRRALAVRRYLAARGVKSSRIRIRYFGERKPRQSNRSKRGRAANRRVLVVIP